MYYLQSLHFCISNLAKLCQEAVHGQSCRDLKIEQIISANILSMYKAVQLLHFFEILITCCKMFLSLSVNKKSTYKVKQKNISIIISVF